jgi:hypothetical protein
MPARGLHLLPRSLRLGTARFLLQLPSVILHLFLLVHFLCKYLERLGFQCLYALGPAVAILSITRIQVGCGSHSS